MMCQSLAISGSPSRNTFIGRFGKMRRVISSTAGKYGATPSFSANACTSGDTSGKGSEVVGEDMESSTGSRSQYSASVANTVHVRYADVMDQLSPGPSGRP